MSDLQTQLPDTNYFFLGDGRIMVVIQWSRAPEASPYGLMLYDPERMSRKNGSLLFHPELGLQRTMLTVIVDGVRHRPRHEDVRVAWDLSRSHAVIIRWWAGPVEVTERFHVQEPSSTLARDISLSGIEEHHVEIEGALYANPLFFDTFGIRSGGVLHASGYAAISFYAVPKGRAFERFLTVPAEHAGNGVVATFIYAIEAVGTHEFSLYPSEHRFPTLAEQPAPVVELGASMAATPDETDMHASPPSLAPRIADLYRISRRSLRAAVSQLGKFDASIWQYDFEWGMDAAMVATAAAGAGLLDLARQVLENILRRLSNAEGMIAEASRFRGGEMSELNGNGAVLDALWHYWRWSGDTGLLHTRWRRIAAIADYPLRAEFHHSSGLLKTRRDLWERTPWMGVKEGFELGHQVFCIVGLRRAGEMAAALGHAAEAVRWKDAAERIHDAMLHHPTLSLIEEGRFIHRRLVDGTVQTHLAPDPGYHARDYAPYIPVGADMTGPPRSCEPDVAEALPIIYGLVDPTSDVVLGTLRALEALWNPTGIGGYARYNIAADPDSPGPWSFATAFMAAAEVEAGLHERARRSISWLMDMAGAGGSWFEYYGERQSPPYPPHGIIVWGWAQYLLLVVKHIVGIRVSGDTIRITPKLTGIEHSVRFGEHRIVISVRGHGRALLNGLPTTLDGGTASIALPLNSDHTLEFLP